MKTLDELKEIDAGEFCPSCGHPFIDHSIEVGCVNCACESNHPQATRLALSDAVQQIEQLEAENEKLKGWMRDAGLDELLDNPDALLTEDKP